MGHRVIDAARRCLQAISRRLSKSARSPTVVPPAPGRTSNMRFADVAIEQLVANEDFQTVLDVGCGTGEHAAYFLAHGKKVTAIDLGGSPYFAQRDQRIDVVVGNFNDVQFAEPFDCVWASHVLEHQPDVHQFLARVHRALRENGVLGITVPPLKHEIVGGHLSLWNAGLLLYHLVIAGFDCREARVLQSGYNISVVVRKRTIQIPRDLAYDAGDIRKLRAYLPASLTFRTYEFDDAFDGDIRTLNWYQ
jgi:SAM-dependent methyltransferase